MTRARLTAQVIFLILVASRISRHSHDDAQLVTLLELGLTIGIVWIAARWRRRMLAETVLPLRA